MASFQFYLSLISDQVRTSAQTLPSGGYFRQAKAIAISGIQIHVIPTNSLAIALWDRIPQGTIVISTIGAHQS